MWSAQPAALCRSVEMHHVKLAQAGPGDIVGLCVRVRGSRSESREGEGAASRERIEMDCCQAMRCLRA